MSPLTRALAVISAVTVLSAACSRERSNDALVRADSRAGQPSGIDAKPLYYRDPMNTGRTSPVPTKDEMGMEYVPVFAAHPGVAGGIRLAPGVVQNLGVRTAPAILGPLRDEWRGSGIVQFDERAIREIYVPTGGWIEKLSVRAVGDSVATGQLLFELYSPALLTVDEQYLQSAPSAGEPAGNPYLAGLRSLGLTDELIADLREKRRSPGRIPFRAAARSTVTELCCKTGALVAQGAPVMRLAATDPAWVIVHLPAAAAAAVARGATAQLTSESYPAKAFDARIDLVYAELDPVAHTLRVRLELPHNEGLLKPNMYVAAIVTGSRTEPVLHVPREAVIRDGRSERVIVATGPGSFAPRPVTLGRESGADVVILQGLKEGERVVTTGIFLLDAEANVSAGLARMSASGETQEVSAPHAPRH